MIPQNVIDRIIDVADIVSTISEYTTLNKAGANYKTVCPFHDDTDASLMVSPIKKLWKCFGCGEGGNVITFLQKHEGVSFPEAVKMLGKTYNIEVPTKELTQEERQQMDQREEQLVAVSAGQTYFEEHRQNQTIENYLKQRGVSLEAMKHFGYGFAPKEFTGDRKSVV